MIKAQRTPLDLMDDIYSIAHWLTGSETKANELVNSTYLNVDNASSETEVFKTFRTCYFESLDSDDANTTALIKQDKNIRLSVLLSSISEFKRRAISRIIGKPHNN